MHSETKSSQWMETWGIQDRSYRGPICNHWKEASQLWGQPPARWLGEWFCLGQEAALWFSTNDGTPHWGGGKCVGVFFGFYFLLVVMMMTRCFWNLEARAPNIPKCAVHSCKMKYCLASNAKSTSTEHTVPSQGAAQVDLQGLFPWILMQSITSSKFTGNEK